jgi:peptidyl-prolyl cis-trans isomerase C
MRPSRLLFSAVLALSLAVAACGRGGGDARPPEPGDRAVAKVQDETIWASDVKREAVAQGLVGEGEPLDVTSDLFRRVLDEVIDQKLLAREAERRGLDNSALAQRRPRASAFSATCSSRRWSTTPSPSARSRSCTRSSCAWRGPPRRSAPV